MALPWYEVVGGNEPLTQGDLIANCGYPVPVKPAPQAELGSRVPAKVSEYTAIVMTQACDLENAKVKHVLLCPYFGLEDFGRGNTWGTTDGKNDLRKGHAVSYHLLNKSELPGFETDYLVVTFKTTLSAHVDFLKTHAEASGPRLRLLPPYREHLSQAFARYFMRVGLPVDIPEFTD